MRVEMGPKQSKSRFFLFTCLLFVIFRASALAQTTPPVINLRFDFRNGILAWQTGFADYPPSTDHGNFQLLAELRSMPPELGVNGTGLYFQGNNNSDDLFMFMKRRLQSSDGIVAGQAYWLDFTVALASNAPSGCGGIGGPPGEGVSLKVGGSPSEPRTVFERDGQTLRMNVDKSNQSQSGIAASVAGNIANGLPCNLDDQPFVSIERSHRHLQPVLANFNGDLWLLVGTDSGFEGLTTLFYQRIEVRLTPLTTPPAPKLLTTRNQQGLDTGRAAALDSLNLNAEPFPVLTTPNFTPDQQTRLILFAYDLELRAGEDASVITAQAEQSGGQIHQLPVEALRKVQDFEWITQLVVRLPLELQNAGEVLISIKLRGVPSNKALVRLE